MEPKTEDKRDAYQRRRADKLAEELASAKVALSNTAAEKNDLHEQLEQAVLLLTTYHLPLTTCLLLAY